MSFQLYYDNEHKIFYKPIKVCMYNLRWTYLTHIYVWLHISFYSTVRKLNFYFLTSGAPSYWKVTYTFASHTYSHHIHILITYTLSSHTHSHHIHILITYTFSSHTHYHHIHILFTYTFSSHTHSHHIHILITYTFSSHTHSLHIPILFTYTFSSHCTCQVDSTI